MDDWLRAVKVLLCAVVLCVFGTGQAVPDPYGRGRDHEWNGGEQRRPRQ